MARYTPGNVPSDPKALPQFLRDEFNKMANALDTSNKFLFLDKQYKDIPNKREGMIALFDKTATDVLVACRPTYFGSEIPLSETGVYAYHRRPWTDVKQWFLLNNLNDF